MKKDTSHEEQLRNYLEGASNVGNKGAEQPESELPDIAAIAPSVVLANLFLEATSQANGDVTCDVCDNLATVELPFKEFDLDGATMESPWLACERCRDLIARRSTKQLIEIVVGQVRPSTEFRPFIERTWKYISKKLFTSLTGEVHLVGDTPAESPWGLPPATLRDSDIVPWEVVSKNFEAIPGKPGVTVMPAVAVGHSDSGAFEVFDTSMIILRGDNLDPVGILTYFPSGSPNGKNHGEYEILVNPEYRRLGIGMSLLKVADDHFGLDFEVQHFTVAGRALAHAYLESRDLSTTATA